MSARVPLLPSRQSSWLLRGASVPGARHLEEAGPSQDAFSAAALAHPEGEIIALLIADGAGSAPRATEGAAIAVGSALVSARRRLAGGLPSNGAAWREAIQGVAADVVAQVSATARALEDCSVEDLSCTLGVVLLSSPWLAMLMIGDTFCVVRRRDGGLHVPLAPAHLGNDPSRTVFLSHPHCLSLAAVAILEDDGIDACAISSDGLDSSALLQTRVGLEPYAPFLNPLLDRARSEETSAQLAQFLLADEGLANTTDDDRTLVMAVRK